MKKKASKPNTNNVSNRKKLTPKIKTNSCRQLLVIDNQPIKKLYMTRIEKTSKQIDEYEKNIHRFEVVDLKKFQEWKNVTFRNEHEKIEKKKDTLLLLSKEVMNCYLIQEELHCHHGKAYNIFRKEEAILEKGTAEEIQSVFKAREVREKVFREKILEVEREEAQENEEFIQFFEELASNFMNDEMDDEADINDDFLNSDKTLSDTENARLKIKSVYRQLVRLLHPDQVCQSITDSLEDSMIPKLWQQVQEAYQKENLEALEMILVQILIKLKKLDQLSVSELIQFHLFSEQQTKDLKNKMNSFKLHTAWNFSQKKSYDKIRKQCLVEIQESLEDLENEIIQVTNELNKMKKSADKENEKALKKQTSQKNNCQKFDHSNQNRDQLSLF